MGWETCVTSDSILLSEPHFLIYKLRDEIPPNLKIPKVYSPVDKCMHKLESGYGVFQMSLETGAGAFRSCGLGRSLGGASSEIHPTSTIPTRLLLLPQQQVKLSSHAFSSLTEADGHCSAAQHSSVRLPEQLLGCGYTACWCNSLLASRQDCMQTVPERKPSTIFLKISKYRNSTPLWCLISLLCNLNLFWYDSSSLSLGYSQRE